MSSDGVRDSQHGVNNNTVILHPVVLLNISEHWTRFRAQNESANQVYGALLGRQAGRKVEISNCFELKVVGEEEIETQDQDHFLEIPKIIDDQYFATKFDLYKQTFPDLEFVGFYVTAEHNRITPEDDIVQHQAMQINESPFLLKFNAFDPVDCDKLNLTIYESIVDTNEESRLNFRAIPLKLDSEFAEQVGLDHVARFSKMITQSESTFSRCLSSQNGSINALMQQLFIASEYVNAVMNGELQPDDSILSDINKLTIKLSATNDEDYSNDSLKKFFTDQKLMILLSTLTNLQSSMFNLVTKLNHLSADRIGPPAYHPYLFAARKQHFRFNF